MSIDLTESIIPKSDQLNADEMLAGPATYTIREVIAGSVEQPFDFLLVETDRAYRPSKTMRRVIVNAWGAEAANYAGRRLTLYREPSITFGGQKVGGIRISHMSHIDGPVELLAQTTRGKRERFVVQPLADLSNREEGESHVNDRAASSNTGQPASAASVGGLQIDSVDAATRVIRAMTKPQLIALKSLLGIEGETTKEALAGELYDARAGHFAEDVHRELEASDA